MFERLVHVLVIVCLGEMQPQPDAHQQPRREQAWRQRFAEQHNSEHCADERASREVRRSSGRAKMAQRQHEERQADAIPEKPDKRDRDDVARVWQRRAPQKGNS
jgi:hypothetical protein